MIYYALHYQVNNKILSLMADWLVYVTISDSIFCIALKFYLIFQFFFFLKYVLHQFLEFFLVL